MEQANSRYEIIYKNFLKDMKRFYSEVTEVKKESDPKGIHLNALRYVLSTNMLEGSTVTLEDLSSCLMAVLFHEEEAFQHTKVSQTLE
jgi:hypothetical protein